MMSNNPPFDRGRSFNRDIERWLACPVGQSVVVTLCDHGGNRRTRKIRRLGETCAACVGAGLITSPHGEEFDSVCHKCGGRVNWEEVE